MESIGEAVERQRARERDHVPAIDQPPLEAPLRLDELVEVNARSILIQSRGELMLSLLDRPAIDMVDLFADLIVAPTTRAAGKAIIISVSLERRTRLAEQFRIECGRQARHVITRRGGAFVAFS